MDKLKDLLARGPDPTRGLRGLALSRYHDIAQARRQLWRWREIAESLDLDPTQGAALGEAFSRVARRIAEGKLEPPAATTAPAPRPSPATKAAARPKAAGVVDPDSGFRTPTAPQKKEGADDHKWIE